MIPFETLQYGETFTNETFDIYGVDLPKGTKLLFSVVSVAVVVVVGVVNVVCALSFIS